MVPIDWIYTVQDISAVRNRFLGLAIMSIDIFPANKLNEVFLLIEEIKILGLSPLMNMPSSIKKFNLIKREPRPKSVTIGSKLP